MSAGPCTLCGGDHARSACPWAKPAADLRAAIVGIRTRPTPLSTVIPAAQAAADSLERAGAEIARLRRALDNRVPIDTAAELRWRVRELEAQLADARRPRGALAWLRSLLSGPGCSGACDQGRRPCKCGRAPA